MSHQDSLTELSSRLPRHAEVLRSLSRQVDADDRWRWLELGCSLGAGSGDDHSDADTAIGYEGAMSVEELETAGLSLVAAVGPTIEALAHRLEGWPVETCRLAVEFANGVQLDLVLMPAEWRPGLLDRTVALRDKDSRLTTPCTSALRDPPDSREAREWMVLGWWALSDVAKYINRNSLYEAAERIAEMRKQMLRLFAVGHGVPFPSFGLTSLLDFPPFELPEQLAGTYCNPNAVESVIDAARTCCRLMTQACESAGRALGRRLATPLSDVAQRRLEDSARQTSDRSPLSPGDEHH